MASPAPPPPPIRFPTRLSAPLPRRPKFHPSAFRSTDLSEIIPVETLVNFFYPSFPFNLVTPAVNGPPRWFIAFEPWYASVCPAFWTLMERDDEHSTAVMLTLDDYLDKTSEATSPEVKRNRAAVSEELDGLLKEMVDKWAASYCASRTSSLLLPPVRTSLTSCLLRAGLYALRKTFLEYHKEQDRLAKKEEKRLRDVNEMSHRLEDARIESGGDDGSDDGEGSRRSSEDSQLGGRTTSDHYRVDRLETRGLDYERDDATIIAEEALRLTLSVPSPQMPGLSAFSLPPFSDFLVDNFTALPVWPAYLSHPRFPCNSTSSKRICTCVLLTDPAPILEQRLLPVVSFCEPIFPVRPTACPPLSAELAGLDRLKQDARTLTKRHAASKDEGRSKW